MKRRLKGQILLLLIASFGLSHANAQADTLFPYPPLGKLVDIGGWNYMCWGREQIKTGQPLFWKQGQATSLLTGAWFSQK